MRFLKVPILMLLVLVAFYLNQQLRFIHSIPIIELSQISPIILSLAIAVVSFALILLKVPFSVCIFLSVLIVDWRTAFHGVSLAILPVILLCHTFRHQTKFISWCGVPKDGDLNRFYSQTGLGLSFEVMLTQKHSFLRSLMMLLQERSIIFKELFLGVLLANLIHIVIEAFSFQAFLKFAIVRSLGETSNTHDLILASALLFLQVRLPSLFVRFRPKV